MPKPLYMERTDYTPMGVYSKFYGTTDSSIEARENLEEACASLMHILTKLHFHDATIYRSRL